MKFFLFLVLVIWPFCAFAQTEGRSRPVGGFDLESTVFARASYDSNVFLQDPSELSSRDALVTAWLLVPGVKFNLRTPHPRTFDFSIQSEFLWKQYLSEDSKVSEQSSLETLLQSKYVLQPHKTWTWTFSGDYRRKHYPRYDFLEGGYFDHHIKPAIEVQFQPNEGKIFKQRLGYAYDLHFMEDIDGLDHQIHRFKSRTLWNFLFQTGLQLDLEWDMIQYFQQSRSFATSENPNQIITLVNVNSMPFRGLLGLSGLLFNRLAIRLQGGYAMTLYEQGFNEDIPIVLTSVTYQSPKQFELSLGYQKDFSDTTFGNYYRFHKIYSTVKYESALGLKAGLDLSVNWRNYSGVEGLMPREDFVIDSQLKLDYFLFNALSIGMQYQYQTVQSDFRIDNMLASYQRHLIFLHADYVF